MKVRRFFGLFAIVILGAIVAVYIYARFFQPEATVVEVPAESRMQYVNLPGTSGGEVMDFTQAVARSIDAVVHVKTKEFIEYSYNPIYEFFFGEQPRGQARPQVGYGSGVIISPNGYIVTNNHVIEDSDEIVVVLNDKREFEAEIVNTDPNTDVALLKVNAEGLPQMAFGDSDNLQLGEWVLAIGNPYNLTSTVTAGIVSAKARDFGLLRGREYSIEAFIQTDAAVNQGNSGGALINTQGELVGINTAIASRTGAFAGYSFAIPVSIVRKVVEDFIEFGEIQRALLGVTITDITAELAQEYNIDKIEGVYVSTVTSDGGARQAGIREGDVILYIDDIQMNSGAQLQEYVSKYRPGEEVKVVVRRDGRLKQYDVVLRNLQGNTNVVQKDDNLLEVLGARFEPVSDREKRELGIRHGVRVTSLKQGKFMKVGIREGFILTSVNKKPVSSVKDIADILDESEGGVIIEGIDSKGDRSYYAFGM